MSKLSPLQLTIIAGSMFLAIVGLLAFAFAGPRPKDSFIIGSKVVVWGTLPEYPIQNTIQTIQNNDSKKKAVDQLPLNLSYTYKEPSTFKSELLEAIAKNEGPDVIILPLHSILDQKAILFTIPMTSYPERTYKDTFIEEGDLFKEGTGYFAIPFTIDPLVLYFNKTLLTQANIINPPKFWDEIIGMVPKLTVSDANSRISRSAIALGEMRNIGNSKDILGALLIQAGSPITTYSYNETISENQLKASLYSAGADTTALPPAAAAIDFYTQFADPTKSTTYTWNRSLPASQDFFTANNLGLYIGYGSEVKTLEDKNPNLNFDMAFLPQERISGKKITYGNLYGASILKSSKNAAGAFQAITSLSSNLFQKTYLENSPLPPVRRDLLSTPPSDAYSPVLYESALKAKGWLDPDDVATANIFREMIESVLSGQALPSEAAQRAHLQMQVLTEKIK